MTTVPDKPSLDGIEANWIDRWDADGTYRFERQASRDDVFAIDIPPPTVSGSLQGMDAMRVEYQRNGAASWSLAAFLTKMPGTFNITPATPGDPENGRIRAVFIKKKAEFGSFSPEYPITLS